MKETVVPVAMSSRRCQEHEILVPVEVRLNWKTQDGEMYWQCCQTTLSRATDDSDAIWKLLTKCLPFEKWRRCDFTHLDFHHYLAEVLNRRGLCAQCAGVSSWEIDKKWDPVDMNQMRSFCSQLQHGMLLGQAAAPAMAFCLNKNNRMPMKLLVVLYQS